MADAKYGEYGGRHWSSTCTGTEPAVVRGVLLQMTEHAYLNMPHLQTFGLLFAAAAVAVAATPSNSSNSTIHSSSCFVLS